MTLSKWKDLQEIFQGITGYWDCSLTSAGTYQDIIGSNHGTIYNVSITDTNNRFGHANKALAPIAASENVSNRIVIPAASIPANECTILIWLKMHSSPNTGYYDTFLGNTNHAGVGSGFLLFFNTGSHLTLYDCRPGKVIIERHVGTPSSWYDGKWHLFGLSTNANNSEVYHIRDGVRYIGSLWQGSTMTGSIVTHIIGNTTGGGMGTGYRAYRNSIGEVYIFNRMLSADELIQFYTLTNGQYLYPLLPGVRCSL